MSSIKSSQSRNGLQAAEEKLFRSERQRLFLCLLVAVAGIAISILLAQMLRKQEQRLAAVQFQHDAERRIEAIQQAAIDRLSVADIIEAFYSGSKLVERNEFSAFCRPLLKKFQGVQFLGWAPLVEQSNRESYERAVREEGFSGYEITELDNNESYVPAGKREIYCPILFIEPFDKFKLLLGFDIRSDPARRSAIDRAIATGRQAAAFCLPSGTDSMHNRVMYVITPISGSGTDSDRPQTIGFAFGVYDIDSVVEDALQPFTSVGIDLNIREHLKTGRGEIIYSRRSPLGDGEDTSFSGVDASDPATSPTPVVSVIDALDRQGEIECVPLKCYLVQHLTWGPTLVLITGITITALSVGYLFLLIGRTARVRRLVTQRTQELQASEQRFRRLVEYAGDTIILHDSNGRIIDANKRASNTLGYSRDELLTMYISDLDIELISGNQLRFWSLPDDEYPVTFEGTHRRKDGSTFPVEIRLVPMIMGGERLMIGLARDITDRKQAELKLRNEQRLLREMLDLQEQDRKLISYDIHDGLAQQLTGALMKFQSIEHMIARNPTGAQEVLHESIHLLKDAVAETRRLIGGLRPPVLDESGVAAAVEVLISGYRKDDSPQIEFIDNLGPRRFAPPLESAIFRIVQESLTNASRYSRSERVRVELGISAERVVIDVRDWGVGFELEKIGNGHHGLRGIRERVRLLGGSATIESVPGQGAHIRVELPLLHPVER
ncbi:MAG: CHASE domain-containing protein [Pirellulales bacterium]|nr:CHASE domain-containing protein [Pirellulales bacterium]